MLFRVSCACGIPNDRPVPRGDRAEKNQTMTPNSSTLVRGHPHAGVTSMQSVDWLIGAC
jgi:hypothetical protein